MHATETSRVELLVRRSRWTKVGEHLDGLHGLPHPVFVTATALRYFPIGSLLHRAGRAYRDADPGYRDVVGFECERPRAGDYGAVIVTRHDPIEGPYHVVGTANEEGEL